MKMRLSTVVVVEESGSDDNPKTRLNGLRARFYRLASPHNFVYSSAQSELSTNSPSQFLGTAEPHQSSHLIGWRKVYAFSAEFVHIAFCL